MRNLRVPLFIILTIILFVSLGAAATGRSFEAELSGSNVIPPVKTMAKGEATFMLSKDGKSIAYKLTVKDMENITAAHIHEGTEGNNGPPVAMLFAGPKKTGKFSGVLSEGTVTGRKLMTSLKGKSVDSLIKMIKDGKAYVNVHTEKYPEGEIRGQIK
jgi:hypothetical protein